MSIEEGEIQRVDYDIDAHRLLMELDTYGVTAKHLLSIGVTPAIIATFKFSEKQVQQTKPLQQVLPATVKSTQQTNQSHQPQFTHTQNQDELHAQYRIPSPRMAYQQYPHHSQRHRATAVDFFDSPYSNRSIEREEEAPCSVIIDLDSSDEEASEDDEEEEEQEKDISEEDITTEIATEHDGEDSDTLIQNILVQKSPQVPPESLKTAETAEKELVASRTLTPSVDKPIIKNIAKEKAALMRKESEIRDALLKLRVLEGNRKSASATPQPQLQAQPIYSPEASTHADSFLDSLSGEIPALTSIQPTQEAAHPPVETEEEDEESFLTGRKVFDDSSFIADPKPVSNVLGVQDGTPEEGGKNLSTYISPFQLIPISRSTPLPVNWFQPIFPQDASLYPSKESLLRTQVANKHKFEWEKKICRAELAGGTCADSKCGFEHFRNFDFDESDLVEFLLDSMPLPSSYSANEELKRVFRRGVELTVAGLEKPLTYEKASQAVAVFLSKS